MLQLGAIRAGFLLGVSLVLAAIIYFFAANWSGLDRMEKSILAAGLVFLFYIVSFALTKIRLMQGYHAFLSSVLLVGGCISFGAAVALLGQIYNSHADSYGLFLMWSIPALLLAWITRYSPFYLLSYTLIHFTLLFYFFPSSLYVNYSEETMLLIGSMFALINLILFVLTEMNRLTSSSLKFISFIILHISLLLLTNSFSYETYGVWMNIACVAAFGIGFYYFIHVRLNKTYLTLNALAISAFAVFKFIELALRHGSFAFFFYGLVFVALLLTGNVFFFRYLNKLGDRPSLSEEQTLMDSTNERTPAVAGKIVSTIVTVIGVIIGSVSLCGLVFLASGINEPQYVLFSLSLLFVILMIFLPRLNSVIRYTVLTIGFIAGMISLVWINQFLISLLFIILSAAAWIRLEGRIKRLFTYALLNLNIIIILFQMLESLRHEFALIVAILSILNAAVYFSYRRLPLGPIRDHLGESSLFFTLAFLFMLTFFGDIFSYSYELFNLIYFFLVSFLVFVFLRRNQAANAAMSMIFWFVYLAFKYYDLLWPLLHKSITFALLGVITLSITYIIARRTGTSGNNGGEYISLWKKSSLLIAIAILLQFGFLGYLTVTSERLLTMGTLIKLVIAPIDPRSMLQGDYVTLNYSISTPPESVAAELESRRSMSKLKVVLSPDERGVHVFNRLYKSGETLANNEIVMNGHTSGWHSINYGIETYFVPEGTGMEVERNARFAYIRVSAGGDALLERLTKE